MLPVETRCKPQRNQGYAQISHSRQRGLPQVCDRVILSLICDSFDTASTRYNKLCGSLRSFAHRLSLLPAQDPFRARMEGQVLSKLYDMGVLNSTAKMSDVENKLTVAAFCRRRLAVVMCMSKMAETVSAVRVSSCNRSRIFVLIIVCLLMRIYRLSSLSNKGTSESGLIPSLTLPTLSLGTPTHSKVAHVRFC